MDLEEELRMIGENLKTLEVAEEKAQERETEYKKQIKTLSEKFKSAEARYCRIWVTLKVFQYSFLFADPSTVKRTFLDMSRDICERARSARRAVAKKRGHFWRNIHVR